jgi:hypothetical protein
VERLELDIVLTEQVLVLAETFQQLSLGKPASSPAARGQRRRHTLRAGRVAICARKSVVTLDLALLTAYTRQHPLWLRRLRGRRRADGDMSGVLVLGSDVGSTVNMVAALAGSQRHPLTPKYAYLGNSGNSMVKRQ